jgi:prepilin-type N-terminal cleavage/methylation domain-containing protein
MSRLRDNRGFTLVEMLVVCTISLIVMGATLTAFESLYRQDRRVKLQRDNADTARLALARASRQLRNLANPDPASFLTIKRADDLDFIFQTSDPTKTIVRYCLNITGTGGRNRAELWESESTVSTPTASMSGNCPGSGWLKSRVVAENVTNMAGGADRNLFTFWCSPGAPSTCPAGIADYPKITSVGMELFIDARRGDNVKEQRVSTGVFLRNQNETPTAVASATRGGTRNILINGSGSSDPEGRTLSYFWFRGSPPASTELSKAKPAGTIREGVLLNYKFDASEAIGTPVTFYLMVRDPGGLTNVIPVQVNIPS